MDIHYHALGDITQFTYFLLSENHKSINLITISQFEEQKCGRHEKVLINKFEVKSKNWKNKLKINEKFKNFHNCKLIMATSDSEPFTYFDQLDKIDKGITTDIAKIISQKGNFTFDVFYYQSFEEVEEKKINPHFEFRIEATSTMFMSLTHVTSTFRTTSLGFQLTPAEKLTNWEKVLLPFDEITWNYLMITFSAAFGSVLLIKKLPKIVQNLVYGENIRDPAFNILGAFFGIGQLQLPSENSARIILVFFIIFCLVIRTAYQGKKLYKLIKFN